MLIVEVESADLSSGFRLIVPMPPTVVESGLGLPLHGVGERDDDQSLFFMWMAAVGLSGEVR